jgi:hypothetical protein
MRLLLHRGQALLLVVVGLAGAAAVGAALERDGLPTPVATRAANLLAPRKSDLPTRIVIASRAPARPFPGPPVPVDTVSDAAASPPTVVQPSPSPTTAVVPPVVYTYPAEHHGGGPGPSGGGSGRGGHD